MGDDAGAPDAAPGVERWDGTTRELAVALRDLARRLREETSEGVPAGEPMLGSPSTIKRYAKARLFRSIRPATRRFDRLSADLATIAADLAERLAVVDERSSGGIERLEQELQRMGSATRPGGDPGAEGVPDDYYWAFEERMRGDPESIRYRLTTYEGLARSHFDRLRDAAGTGTRSEAPRWIDLGCGNGEFCQLLREWGWKVEGVDSSPSAIQACRERGIEVTLGEAVDYLATRREAPVAALSAIQVIEHLPRERWISFFEGAFRALEPGGGFLVETINGRNAEAVADHFVADVTHTWPAHPETLRLMAEHVGFSDVEIRFENEDERGSAGDVAVWARKTGP